MAGLTIGGWFASACIDKLADQVVSYMQGNWEYQAGVKDKLQKLEQHLTMIKAVIHAADGDHIANPGLSAWLCDLKDAAYSAEDVLDTFEYQILAHRLMSENQVCNTASSSSYDVAKSAVTFVKRLIFCDDDLNELNDVVERFDSIVSKVGGFLALLRMGMGTRRHGGGIEWRETTSIPVETQIVGRQDDIENIVGLLTTEEDESTSRNNKFDVISIVGMGGVGKTTLAQAVYNNSKVGEFFDLKVWVCVSDDFDLIRLTKEIIESACIDTSQNFHHLKNLDRVQGFLSRGLTGKRFLIVLDDVWNEIPRKWEVLRTPFACGKAGSHILITTRNQDIADMMGTRKSVALEGLKHDDYNSFFTQCAFGNADPRDYPKLESIGRQIAAKLGGSPLAAKTVGGILKHNLLEEHWRDILQSSLGHLEQGEDGILPALRLSYEHLPAHLKQCFVYCSLFPKDFVFNRDELVRMWMAHGFILCNSRRKRMEDVGRDYFELLLSRCFFERTVGSDNEFVIHDLMHDLAQSVSPDEYLIIKDEDSFEVPRRTRHLFLYNADINKVYKITSRITAVRSLVISGWIDDFNLLHGVIKELRSLRILVFYRHWSIELPQIFDYLRHLRYLSLHLATTVQDLKSVCSLYQLQGLHLPRCQLLPKEINQLINLRYLNAHPERVCTIPYIGRLTFLQELKEFHLKKEKGYELSQLQDMRQLRGRLCIKNLQNAESEEDISDAVLVSKEHLTALQLEWGGTRHVKSEELLESLRPHCNLKELKIKNYSGTKSPSWMDTKWLLNIEFIYFDCCRIWEVLPPLGQLPFLKLLKLIDMRAVKQIGPEFYGSNEAFVNLEELIFEDMWNLEKWSGPATGCMFFSRLRKLHIRNCPKFMCALPINSLLKKLEIQFCSNLIAAFPGHLPNTGSTLTSASFVLLIDNASLLPRWLPAECMSSLQELAFRGFTRLTSFTDEQEGWLLKLTSIKQLTLSSCWNLRSLPANLVSLPSLEMLLIDDCSGIHSLPEMGLPASLKELHIYRCHRMLAERCEEDTGADWPKIKHIPTICIRSKTVWPQS